MSEMMPLSLAIKNCETCGSTENLVKHHITYEPELTKILCRKCHEKAHAKPGAIRRPSGFNYFTGKCDLRKTDTVAVMVSMSNRFLKKIDAHLVKVAEGNRSAWVRHACLNLMREEQADIRAEDY